MSGEGGGPTVLSAQEAVELERFSHGKTRIEGWLRTLESRPLIEPLAGFTAVENVSLQNLWPTLDNDIELAAKWSEERDQIEEQAVEFNQADMEKLRRLAKGGSRTLRRQEHRHGLWS